MSAPVTTRATAHTPLASAAFRTRFPMLERTVHLASCSLGARSTDIDDALMAMLDEMATGGAPWSRFEEQVHQARHRFAALVGARLDQVAVLPNASVAAFQVASTMDWRDRPVLVTTNVEFPSIAHVWLAARPSGAEVRYAKILPAAPEDDLTSGYASLVDERTKLVSVPLTTYQDAVRLPVAAVARLAHESGARVFVDAYQAAGVEPVDVVTLGCDYLVAGASKYLLGLPGLAFLYAREPGATDHSPRLTGWFGRVDPFAFDPRRLDFPDSASRFETGTPAVPSCYAAVAGLGLVGSLDLTAVRDHVSGLTAHAAELLTAAGERVRTPVDPQRRGAHIGLLDPAPAELAHGLAARGVAVSPRGDVVRISCHYYNNHDDVAALCDALGRYRRDASGWYRPHQYRSGSHQAEQGQSVPDTSEPSGGLSCRQLS